MRNKTDDNRFYILTLFAIAFGIEDAGQYKNDLMHINLLVGLPPAHYGGQYEQFQNYFMSKEIEEFEFRNKQFKIFVDGVAVYPQAYAAAVTVFSRICSGKAVFVGGGSILLRNQIEASDKVSSTIFVESISANAKGYEILHRAAKVKE